MKIQSGDYLYNSQNIGSSRRNLTKMPIILCAVGGILLGSFAFKVANIGISSGDKNSVNSGSKSMLAAEALKLKVSDYEALDKVNDMLFKSFGMDRYNPITILNANYPYFKMFYNNEYQNYLAQLQAEKEKEEAEAKAAAAVAQTNEENTAAKEQTGAFKEVSSCITYEDDVSDEEKDNSSVVTSGKVNIINQTKYSIDINKLLKEPLKLPDKKGPQILVYHTHTTESFLKSLDQLTMKNIASRTTDSKYNVTRVGNSLVSDLEIFKIDVLHDVTIHDKDYNSSYVNSLKTLTKYVNKYPSLKMTIDLHRDAVSGEKLRVVKKVDGKDAAQIMFVIGTDSKLSNPNWRDNLKLAVKIQARLNEICPGLAKPIYLSKSRYNQHLTNGSVIVEIGGDGNVIDECVRSTKYLAQAINDVMYK